MMAFQPIIGPKLATVQYEIIGGGGSGGFGRNDGGENFRGTFGNSGENTTVEFLGGEVITSTGAAGGENCKGGRGTAGTAGLASEYGSGGAGGALNRNGSPAPSDHYGAGGGGGGGDRGSLFDSGGCSGEGGRNAQRMLGTRQVPYGTNLPLTVGAGGPFKNNTYDGGAGAGGYIKLIVDKVVYEYTNPGNYNLQLNAVTSGGVASPSPPAGGYKFFNLYDPSTGSDEFGDLAIDSTGRIALGGLAGATVVYNGARGKHVAVVSKTGIPEFGFRFDAPSTVSDRINGLAFDSNDNLIVLGQSTGGIPYVVKYNSSGTELWKYTYDTVDGVNFQGITVDSNDNICLAGQMFRDPNYYGDPCVLKLDPDGTELWATYVSYDSYGTDINDVTCDSNDNIILAGTTEIQNLDGAGEDRYVGVVVKFTPAGSVVWQRRIRQFVHGGTFRDLMGLSSCTVDSSDNIHVGGASLELADTNSVYHIYHAKLDNNGTLLFHNTWLDTAKTTTRGFGGAGVAVDSLTGDVYLSSNASFEDNTFLLKLNSAGSYLWGMQITGIGDGYRVATNGANERNPVVVGTEGAAQISKDGTLFSGAATINFVPGSAAGISMATIAGSTGSFSPTRTVNTGTTTPVTINRTVLAVL